MKRALAWIACLMLLTPLMAAEQPKSGDMTFGPSYGTFSTESDLSDYEGLYGLEWEGWLNDRLSFGLGAFRTEENADISGDFFLALHHKILFVEGVLSYLNEPDDTTTAGVGVGLSLMPSKSVRIKVGARAGYVLGDLDLVKESHGTVASIEHVDDCHSEHCDETPSLIREVESVDVVYRIGAGVSWVW